MKYKEFLFNNKIIRGFLYENKKSDDIVIIFHGFTGNKSDHHFMFKKFADTIFDKNFSVYRFDFLGSGDSDGTFYDDESINHQIEQGLFISEYFKNKGYNIHIFGFSMGGVVASHLTKYQNISSLFLLSPAGNFNEILKNALENANKYNDIYDIDGFQINQKFIDEAYNFKYFEGLEKYKNPVHITQGTDDTIVSKQSLLNFKNAFENCTIKTIEGGDHCFKSTKLTNAVIKEIKKFYGKIKNLECKK